MAVRPGMIAVEAKGGKTQKLTHVKVTHPAAKGSANIVSEPLKRMSQITLPFSLTSCGGSRVCFIFK